ncbi:MAG: acyl-CoA synthetase [Pseudomonadales bacterium]|nr:acyl-CoA synthetase [Pseudomonadales bacterium]
MPLPTADTTDFFPPLRPANDDPALLQGTQSWSYAALDARSKSLASGLLHDCRDLEEERIAFFMPASVDYVTALLGVWRAGGIAVPLNVAAAMPELEHVLTTAGVRRLLIGAGPMASAGTPLRVLCARLDIAVLTLETVLQENLTPLPLLDPGRRALMLFTSGTTNKPKGVVSTHRNIRAQISTLLEAWAWQRSDALPLFLPLHHIHGIINILCCALWAGARVELFVKFDADAVLTAVANGAYTVFMAVPTVYVLILRHLSTLPGPDSQRITTGFAAMRLNVSGSAACPVTLFQQWQALTGQTLLERYGMTEIGMGIANPYRGERRAGAVGLPLPGVEVALHGEDGRVIAGDGEPGEIRIRGDNVFLEYWNNPQATAQSFRAGWFCTGDIAVREDGYYRIMGRASVDIIKSGGYKLSALEIEDVLLAHAAIAECAVIGIEDATWGELVSAFVVLRPGTSLSLAALKHWCEGRLSPYKVPRQLQVLTALPRNAMGKVTKPALKALVPPAP